MCSRSASTRSRRAVRWAANGSIAPGVLVEAGSRNDSCHVGLWPLARAGIVAFYRRPTSASVVLVHRPRGRSALADERLWRRSGVLFAKADAWRGWPRRTHRPAVCLFLYSPLCVPPPVVPSYGRADSERRGRPSHQARERRLPDLVHQHVRVRVGRHRVRIRGRVPDLVGWRRPPALELRPFRVVDAEPARLDPGLVRQLRGRRHRGQHLVDRALHLDVQLTGERVAHDVVARRERISSSGASTTSIRALQPVLARPDARQRLHRDRDPVEVQRPAAILDSEITPMRTPRHSSTWTALARKSSRSTGLPSSVTLSGLYRAAA